jgi:signal transduction histidine kinase
VDLSQVLDRLAAAAARVLSVETAVVLLLEEAEDRLVVAVAYGVDAQQVSVPTPLLPSLPIILVEDARVDPQGVPFPPGLVSAVGVPLGVRGRLLGWLWVYGPRPGQFTSEDGERLQALADLGGMAVQAARGLADLERIELSKSRFIRVATHELRSPVTVAQSLVRTVLKGYVGPLTEQQREIFERVAGRLDFLESLVNDLLDLAASRAPELAEEEGPVAVNGSVGRAVLLLQPRAEEKGVSLTVHPCREELAVWATEEGLDRIFVNLIGNAVKYTPAGGRVTVSLSREGETARVEVADTGIGVPEESLPHLFEEFYRAPNARQFDIGTGLGLAIVKELVDRYGGRIEVESRVGEGTTFTVAFPLWRPP